MWASLNTLHIIFYYLITTAMLYKLLNIQTDTTKLSQQISQTVCNNIIKNIKENPTQSEQNPIYNS